MYRTLYIKTFTQTRQHDIINVRVVVKITVTSKKISPTQSTGYRRVCGEVDNYFPLMNLCFTRVNFLSMVGFRYEKTLSLFKSPEVF